MVALSAPHSPHIDSLAHFGVNPKLKVSFFDLILHLAGNDGVFAFFELVPKINLSSPLKVKPSDCKLAIIEFIQLFLV